MSGLLGHAASRDSVYIFCESVYYDQGCYLYTAMEGVLGGVGMA
jgi:hypothetical protein